MYQEMSREYQELLKLVKDSMATHGEYWRAKKQGTAVGEELKKLEAAANASRGVFDKRVSQLMGGKDGRIVSQNWGYFVQKAFVFELVPEAAFYYVDPRHKEELRDTAKAYVNAHKVLNRTVEYGVNPRSVETLLEGLNEAIKNAGVDVERAQILRAVRGNLERRTETMRANAAKKAEAQSQPTQSQPKAATEMGQAMADATKAAAERPASKRTGRRPR